MNKSSPTAPGLWQSLIPLLVLTGLLFLSVRLFGSDSSAGPNQIALILTAMTACAIGLWNGHRWGDLEAAMVQGIGVSMSANFILLAVGSLIGTWMLAGIVPAMIYYGLQILHPTVFYAATCALCAVVSVATGSSWSTAGTVGIALMGIGQTMGLNPAITAGAIISGAYFGDKMSPLSDTTNLASAVAGTDLFTHIRHMLWTTVPSITVALVLFGLIGMKTAQPLPEEQIELMRTALASSFRIGWYLLIPPVLVIVMVMKKVAAFPALMIAALLGGVFAVIFQQGALGRWMEGESLSVVMQNIKGVWLALFSGYQSATGDVALDELLSRGGMGSMLDTVWLILSAMMFGAAMEKTGMLACLAGHVLVLARSTGSLVATTIAMCIGTNLITSDQYISIVLPGRMFRTEFAKRRLHPKNLSRTLEDAGTLTSALVPWNTGGAYMAGVLGVATTAYLPFCFFNLLNPVIAAVYGYANFTIEKLDPTPEETP